MEARVIKAFTDRDSGEVKLPGDTFSGDARRVAELAEGGWVEKPAQRPRKKQAQ